MVFIQSLTHSGHPSTGKEHYIYAQENLSSTGTFWARVHRTTEEEKCFLDAMEQMGLVTYMCKRICYINSCGFYICTFTSVRLNRVVNTNLYVPYSYAITSLASALSSSSSSSSIYYHHHRHHPNCAQLTGTKAFSDSSSLFR